MTRAAGGLLACVLLTACGGEPAAPAEVRVEVGVQDRQVAPTQYCLDGEGQRYRTAPPILEVSPDAPIRLTVPDEVAERGWSVQVFDTGLEQLIGEVAVPEGQQVFEEIGTSDVVPPAFYLVVVEDSGGDCGAFSGAWPVGFIRAGGDLDPSPGAGQG